MTTSTALRRLRLAWFDLWAAVAVELARLARVEADHLDLDEILAEAAERRDRYLDQ